MLNIGCHSRKESLKKRKMCGLTTPLPHTPSSSPLHTLLSRGEGTVFVGEENIHLATLRFQSVLEKYIMPIFVASASVGKHQKCQIKAITKIRLAF